MSSPERPAGTAPDPEAAGTEASGPEQKLERLLAAAAGLMARRGYGQTSIRNVARETGFSLAGMYYYFENKEDLLFQIQHRTFASLLQEQERVVAGEGDPEPKLRHLVQNHLSYFISHFSELKVCTFELQTLQGERYRQIEDLRRRYFRCLAGVIGQITGRQGPGPEIDPVVRHYTLFVFGMLNWIFMWFEPGRRDRVTELGEEMISLVLPGLRGEPAAGS